LNLEPLNNPPFFTLFRGYVAIQNIYDQPKHGQKPDATACMVGGRSVKAFDTLTVGDSIHARYTEAIAISVEKP
jgi:hypothetical protein